MFSRQNAAVDSERIFTGLLQHFGPQHWWPAESTFEIALGAIVVQRTSWHNAAAAVANLRHHKVLEPSALLALKPAQLMSLIRPAGFFRQKTARVYALAQWWLAHGGEGGIASLDDVNLRNSLLAINGVGAETADAIALYAFERPRFVADAYARRIFARMHKHAPANNYEQLRLYVENALGADVPRLNEFHALLVKLGQQYCAPRPRCQQCPLSADCTFSGQQS